MGLDSDINIFRLTQNKLSYKEMHVASGRTVLITRTNSATPGFLGFAIRPCNCVDNYHLNNLLL